MSTENEFKSETEGPTNATDDPMAKYFALGNLFVTFKEGWGVHYLKNHTNKNKSKRVLRDIKISRTTSYGLYKVER